MSLNRRGFHIGIGAMACSLAHPHVAAGPGTRAPVKIGQSAVLTGPVGVQMQLFNAGARLALDRLNQAGGIAGRPVELVTLEDQLRPELAIENTRRLAADPDVRALFGYLSSPIISAIDPLLQESGLPLVAPVSVTDATRAQTAGRAYYVRAGYEREVDRLVRQLDTVGIDRIGLAYITSPTNTPGAGEEIKALLDLKLDERKRPRAVSAALSRDGSNVDQAAELLARARPQATILVAPADLPAKLIAGISKRGVHSEYYGVSMVAAELTAKLLGTTMRSMVVAQVVPYPWGSPDPTVADFRKLAEAAKLPLSYVAMEGYASASVLVQALQRAGRDPSPRQQHAALQSLRGHIAGLDIDFTTSNTGSRFVELVQITSSGRFIR